MIENRLSNLFSARRLDDIVLSLPTLFNIVREAVAYSDHRPLRDPRSFEEGYVNWESSAESSVLNKMRNRSVEIFGIRGDDHFASEIVRSKVEVNTALENSARADITQKLGSEQEDAALAEQKQVFVEKRKQQIGFLLNIWPWRVIGEREPSNHFV